MSLLNWQRASLPLLILRILHAGPRHGYGISQALVDAGLRPVKGAQLYPALVRLEADHAIVGTWELGEAGPARKVYSLTDSGQARLGELEQEWSRFVSMAERLR